MMVSWKFITPENLDFVTTINSNCIPFLFETSRLILLVFETSMLNPPLLALGS